MPVLDLFNTSAFDTISLTTAVNALPFVPSRVGEMKLFAAQGVPNTTIAIEEKNGLLALLPTAQRGEVGSVAAPVKRKVRSFAVPHIPHYDAVHAADIQNVRKFGSENQLESIAEIVNDRLALMRQHHETTEEHLRLGALQGKILDSDGSTTIFNLFTEFSVTEGATDFVLGTAGTDIRGKCLTVIRAIEDVLGATGYDHIHCFAHDLWFDDFISHADVKAAFDRFQDGEMLRNDPRAGFTFANITFENYRGKVGSNDFMVSDEARFFPVGVAGLFQTFYAPADFTEAVNTIGIPVYAKQERMKFDKGIELHTQSNPLPMCTQPEVLHRGHTSN